MGTQMYPFYFILSTVLYTLERKNNAFSSTVYIKLGSERGDRTPDLSGMNRTL